jgi:HK97 gp10 family phage protein
MTLRAEFDFTALGAQLDNITKAAQAATRPVAQAGAQVFHDEVRARVPMSAKPHKSGKKVYTPGNLRRAIYQAYMQDESNAEASYYRVSWNKANAFYGNFLEHGTAKMAAQPFIRPGYDAARNKAVAAMQAEMAKQLLKVQVK